MSGRRKDSESSGWGALGAAVGIGAAIVGGIYIGKKLYDEYQEEKALQEKLSYADSKEEGACGFGDPNPWTLQKKVRDVEDVAKHRLPSPDLEDAPEQSLQHALEEYYESYASIPHHAMARAQNVVDYVKDQVLYYLQSNSKLRVGRLVDAGSSTEGLKVIRPDEFDVEIHLNLDTDALEIEDAESVPDYVLLKLSDNYPEYSKFRSSTVDGDFCMNPQKIRSYFQGEIHKAINGIGRYEISGPAMHGPAVTLKVEYERDHLYIDFVPVVVIGSQQIVAKPHPEYLRKDNKEYENYWRWSFSGEERAVIRSLPASHCHRKVLKIMKAIRENHPSQFGMFRSYTFKTILLHMIDDTFLEEWADGQLQERFIDFLKRFEEHLVHRSLPHYFVRELNLFDELQPSALDNTKFFLQKKISKSALETLLKKNKAKY